MIKGKVTQYEDFKYVMQDTGNIYLGARYSYRELLEAEAVPFKLKAILTHYMLKEASPETTLESEFYYMKPETFLFETWQQLKVRVKVQVRAEKKSLSGKSKINYQEKILTLKELTDINPAGKKALGLIINEVILSKLGMMTFSV